MEIQSVAIIGSGVMGRGIVASFLRGGHDVTLVSRNPSRAAGHLGGDVQIVAGLSDAAPDFIIEAVPEEIDLKHALFAEIEARYGGHPIIATNTSGLPMDDMAARLNHPERFIGVHYMQPAEALPMVEVIRAAATSDAVLAATVAALARNGQGALVLNRPVPGFLVNRLQHAMLHEALAMIEQGICTVEDVDNFARRMFGPRLCVTGLIEQKDISGLQVTAATHRNLIPDLNHTNKPVALLQDMVTAGNHGMATGQGFYDWRGRDTEAHKQRAAEKLTRILEFLADDPD